MAEGDDVQGQIPQEAGETPDGVANEGNAEVDIGDLQPNLATEPTKDSLDVDYVKKKAPQLGGFGLGDENGCDVIDEEDVTSPAAAQLGLDRFGLPSPKAGEAKELDASASPKAQDRPNTADFVARPATAPAPAMPDEPHVTPENAVFADETRAALLHAAALTDPTDRMARDLALNSLQRLATGSQNKTQLWEDTVLGRKVILDAAAMEDLEDNEGRCCALGTLWNIAGDSTLRAAMWTDDTTKATVLKAASSEKKEVRDLGLGILWGLSPKANAASMWQDEAVRASIVAAATGQDPEGRKGRAYAMAIIQNLAEETTNRVGMWADASGVRKAITMAAGLIHPEDKDLRGRAVGALMNLSVEEANKAEMWNDADGIRAAILEAALLGPGLDDKSRGCALAVVWCLAIEQTNRSAMCSDVKVREALVQAAASNGDRRSRERALGTMQYLSTEPGNKEMMWDDQGLRDALVSSIETPGEGKARAYGLGAIWNLSSCAKNQEKMWKDEATKSALVDVALNCDSGESMLLERSMAIFWNLSSATGNKVSLWKDEKGGRAALLTVISGNKSDQGLQARQFALGALRNLSDEPRNKVSMWNDANSTRRLLIEAANSEDPVSSRRAFKALTSLVHEQTIRTAMWNDEGHAGGAAASALSAAAAAAAAGTAGVALATAAAAVDAGAGGPSESGVRALVIKCASQPWSVDNSDTHTSAIIALQALSVEAANKESMWNEPTVRAALVASARLTQPEAGKAKLCAISTLKNLTTEASIMAGMWSDEDVRSVLVAAGLPGGDTGAAAVDAAAGAVAAAGGAAGAAAAAAIASALPASSIVHAEKARAAALGALRNLSSAAPNKEGIWADEAGARAAIIAAAEIALKDISKDVREARMHAVGALRSLSSVNADKTDPLWKDCEAAKSALIAAAALSTTEHADHKSREYAVAALRHAS